LKSPAAVRGTITANNAIGNKGAASGGPDCTAISRGPSVCQGEPLHPRPVAYGKAAVGAAGVDRREQWAVNTHHYHRVAYQQAAAIHAICDQHDTEWRSDIDRILDICGGRGPGGVRRRWILARA